jgi:glucuronoarabinoxylan endo-1,4-beta-xylanase
MLSCTPKTTQDNDGDVNVDLAVTYQNIRGFGGMNMPGWIADLTTGQAERAFGMGAGQIGLSILRVRVPFDQTKFNLEVPTAKITQSHSAIVFATPWSPPANMKSNSDTVGGLER